MGGPRLSAATPSCAEASLVTVNLSQPAWTESGNAEFTGSSPCNLWKWRTSIHAGHVVIIHKSLVKNDTYACPCIPTAPTLVNNSSAGVLWALLWMLHKNTSQPATFRSRIAAKKKTHRITLTGIISIYVTLKSREGWLPGTHRWSLTLW